MSSLNGQSEPNQSANYEDPERIRLQPPGAQGTKYTQQINETNELGVRYLTYKTFAIDFSSGIFLLFFHDMIPSLGIKKLKIG